MNVLNASFFIKFISSIKDHPRGWRVPKLPFWSAIYRLTELISYRKAFRGFIADLVLHQKISFSDFLIYFFLNKKEME